MVATAKLPTHAEEAEPTPFGIYLHWPFCRAKCPYCDFNSHVREAIDHATWREALLAELDHYAALAPGRTVSSVFFGGGTPSLMAPETVAALIARIDHHWPLDDTVEITLEANPTSVEAASFAGFRAAGVNRLSLGVQALDDAALAFLGRQHSATEALAAVALARRHFPRFSFDLIYARPGQSVEAWQAELHRALDEGAAHLSLYQLTLETGTAFHAAARRGELALPPEEEGANLYLATQELTAAADLPAYEVSNHARPGEACRHNLLYWRYGDYLGIGPGAHGRLTLARKKIATRQHRAPEAWLAAVERQGHATREDAAVGREARLAEMVMMGLRLTEGIARAAFRRELDAEPEALFEAGRLEALSAEGYLVLDENGLRATPAGLQRLNALLGYLLA